MINDEVKTFASAKVFFNIFDFKTTKIKKTLENLCLN